MIPAAKLKMFSASYPDAINYGSTGAIVAHEFTHGFDDIGSHFDGRGTLKNWWSDLARERFNNRSRCFVRQYGNELDSVTGLRVSKA